METNDVMKTISMITYFIVELRFNSTFFLSVPPKPKAPQNDPATADSTSALISLVLSRLTPDVLARFVEKFLLESNSVWSRWQAHALVLALHRGAVANGGENNSRTVVVSVMWKLWRVVPAHGRRAAQFVDLLG
jgi:hypothetical protein